MGPMAGIRVVVTGRVQGVGFRAFVRALAEDLELVGEVWNRRDGAVECVAFGDEALLDDFVARLALGPGRPEHFRQNPEPDPGGLTGFFVSSTR